jgi:hypothetical protein
MHCYSVNNLERRWNSYKNYQESNNLEIRWPLAGLKPGFEYKRVELTRYKILND